MDKFDIIIIAGQSNAEGNGLGKNDRETYTNENVMQIIDVNPVNFYEDQTTKQMLLDVKFPVEMKVCVADERIVQDSKIADFAQTFAKEYINAGKLEEGRKILLVKTAVGGTGFAKKQWGLNNPLSNRLFEMVDYALTLGESKVVALLWHQGEHDAFENAQLNSEERYNFYFENFTTQMTEIRKKYGNMSIIAGEFVNHWADKNAETCNVVEKSLKDACFKIGNAGVASSEGLLSNDQSIGNGDDIHFCAEAIYELGKRYFEIYKNLN
jgi:hypothetical protein